MPNKQQEKPRESDTNNIKEAKQAVERKEEKK